MKKRKIKIKFGLVSLICLGLGILAIVAMFFPFVKYYVESDLLKDTYVKTLFSGFALAFGSEEIVSEGSLSLLGNGSVTGSVESLSITLIAFIVTIVGLVFSVLQVIADKKCVNYCKLIAAACFVAAGVLAIFTCSSFIKVNEIPESSQEYYSLGVGAIVFAVLNILAGLGKVYEVVKK